MSIATRSAHRLLLACLLIGTAVIVARHAGSRVDGFAQEGALVNIHMPVTIREAAEFPVPVPLAPGEATAAAQTATAAAEPSATMVVASPTVSPTLEATATASAVVTETAVPATTTATEVPTETATPEASATATVQVECRDIMYNGSFDEGSNRWGIESTYRARTLSQIIIKQPQDMLPRPVDGEWIARLGGGRDGGLDEFFQPYRPDRPWTAVSPDAMVSATLRFSFAVFTEMTLDRRPDDTLTFLIHDIRSGREYAIENGMLSEESAPSLTWQRYELDVTRQMTGAAGNQLGLKIRSQMRELADGQGTFHYLDAMSLEVCTVPQ